MNNEQYRKAVLKRLWFLNRHEKSMVKKQLNDENIVNVRNQFKTSNQFANSFLNKNVINHTKPHGKYDMMFILIGLFLGNVIFLGMLITAILLILGTISLYFTKDLSTAFLYQIIYILIGIVLLIIGYNGIKKVNSYFTKRLLIEKNKKNIE